MRSAQFCPFQVKPSLAQQPIQVNLGKLITPLRSLLSQLWAVFKNELVSLPRSLLFGLTGISGS